jgi:hypothetical protein
VDAALALFYTPALVGGDSSGGGKTFSRSAEKRTLMTHYALVLALHIESFAMAAEQARVRAKFALTAGDRVLDRTRITFGACGGQNKGQGQGRILLHGRVRVRGRVGGAARRSTRHALQSNGMPRSMTCVSCALAQCCSLAHTAGKMRSAGVSLHLPNAIHDRTRENLLSFSPCDVSQRWPPAACGMGILGSSSVFLPCT